MWIFLNLPVRVVDDATECSSECAVELDLGFVFITASLVHVRINEALHRVDVQDLARDHMIRVWEDFDSKRLV